jgi:hypothetical protein
LNNKYFDSLGKLFKLVIYSSLISFLTCCSEEPLPEKPEPPIDPPKDIRGPSVVGYSYQEDSIKIDFNEPLSIFHFDPDGPFGLISAERVVSSDSKSILIKCSACHLGGDFKFKYRLYDTAGNSIDSTVTVSYYDKKKEFAGQINEILLDEERGILYMLLSYPHKLLLLNWSDLSILSEHPLPIFDFGFVQDDLTYIRMAYNPHNSLFYFYHNLTPKLFIYSPEARKFVKTIEVQGTPYDHPDFPSNTPTRLLFSSTGFGLMITFFRETHSRIQLKAIDSRVNDTIYRIEDFEPTRLGGRFNQSTIFAAENPIRLRLFDGITGIYNDLNYDGDYRDYVGIGRIVPHKTKQNIFLADGQFAQFIGDHQGNASSISFIETWDRGWGDFSYRAGEDSLVYYYNGDKIASNLGALHLMNYENRTTPITYRALAEMKGFEATVDDKYLFAFKGNTLYFFTINQIRKKKLN